MAVVVESKEITAHTLSPQNYGTFDFCLEFIFLLYVLLQPLENNVSNNNNNTGK